MVGKGYINEKLFLNMNLEYDRLKTDSTKGIGWKEALKITVIQWTKQKSVITQTSRYRNDEIILQIRRILQRKNQQTQSI